MKQLIFFTSIVLIVFSAQAQTECSQYHKKGCEDKKGAFMKYDGQSKSAIMAKGQKSEFHLVAYSGQDYRVTVCNESNLGNEVLFKIYEKQKVFANLKADEVLEDVLEEVPEDEEISEDYSEDDYSEDDYSEDDYDDYEEEEYTEDAYSEEVVSTAGSNRPQFKLVKELLYDNSQDGYNPKIEFTAEGSMSLIIEVTVPGSNSGMKLKVRETGCVGVLIERTKSQRTGF
ncbi:MAG: hypothetical protein QMC40_10485 [Vicingaceae bacterium]